jgi:hypothetical protein
MNHSMRAALTAALVSTTSMTLAAEAHASALGGSRASMQRQHQVAVEQEFTFTKKPAQVDALVKEGKLVPVRGNADYRTSNVSFPYARPEVRLFIERLATQYRDATGKQLVVTSLTRPSSRQPSNASALSVHPAGMAVDLRVPDGATERAWLERTLLSLEDAGVLDVTRERRPPHYHVAVFPTAYVAYAAQQRSVEKASIATPVVRVAQPVVVSTRLPPPPSPASIAFTGAAALLALFASGSGVAASRRAVVVRA